MTYTALSQRPIELNAYQQDELAGSVQFDFRTVKDEEEDLEDDSDLTPGLSTPAETADNPESQKSMMSIAVEKAKEYLSEKMVEDSQKPKSLTPASLKNSALVVEHHSSNPVVRSLYSEGLHVYQPDNAVNAFGEPPFTNWAQGYRETLDYIFLVDDELRKDTIRLTGLLKMPRKDEMGEGEPQEGRFPSDHVCLMAEIEVL
jgi:mRNA deadenylase 3'-5' endonuclease subunit Ccr4